MWDDIDPTIVEFRHEDTRTLLWRSVLPLPEDGETVYYLDRSGSEAGSLVANPAPLEEPPGTKPEAWVVYWGFDQHLQVYSRETYGQERGWGLFGRLSLSDGNPTPVKWFGSLGIGGDSPFASPFHGRNNDTFGIGMLMYAEDYNGLYGSLKNRSREYYVFENY